MMNNLFLIILWQKERKGKKTRHKRHHVIQNGKETQQEQKWKACAAGILRFLFFVSSSSTHTHYFFFGSHRHEYIEAQLKSCLGCCAAAGRRQRADNSATICIRRVSTYSTRSAFLLCCWVELERAPAEGFVSLKQKASSSIIAAFSTAAAI